MNANGTVTLTLTNSEAQALKEKLEWLMREANGVDIWLAPGGDVQLEGPNADDCFLDCDEEAHYRLGTVLEKLGGEFQPHRDSNFKPPLEQMLPTTVRQLQSVYGLFAEMEFTFENNPDNIRSFEERVSAMTSNLSTFLLNNGVNPGEE